VFEQLDDDFFYNLYQAREIARDKINEHAVLDLAIIPWSIRRIESQADVVFFRRHEEDVVFDSVVIGYDGRECFMLTSQCGSHLKPETTIQCSSLIDTSIQGDIVKFVLSELVLGRDDLSWINPDVNFPLENINYVS
jgi:phosphoribosylaminoimidazole carboxylase (NCAIR synthetase)